MAELPPQITAALDEPGIAGYHAWLALLVYGAAHVLRRRSTDTPAPTGAPLPAFLEALTDYTSDLVTRGARMTPRESAAVQLLGWVAEVYRAAEEGDFSQARFGMANLQAGIRAAQLKLGAPRAAAQQEGARKRTEWMVPARRVFDETLTRVPRATARKLADEIKAAGVSTPSDARLLEVVEGWKRALRD